MTKVDGASMAYWFPLLSQTGVKVPRTVRLDAPESLLELLDGKADDAVRDFIGRIGDSFSVLGGPPVFLRTEMGSGKQDWEYTCFLQGKEGILRHVHDLVQWSHCVEMMGLPHRHFFVREMLSVKTYFRAFGGNMPIAREMRVFIEDGRMVCLHPYWPEDAIQKPNRQDWRDRLRVSHELTASERAVMVERSEWVSTFFPGAWSLDWLHTTCGWVAIDMAPAERSWHMPDCSAALERGWDRKTNESSDNSDLARNEKAKVLLDRSQTPTGDKS